MTGTAEEQLRTQVRDTIAACGLKQIWIADKLGISQKHLSQLLTGRVSLTLDWAEKILTLCRGARMLLFVTVPPGPADRPDRIRLDDLTSNNLDDLYDDLDRYAEVVGEMNEHAVKQAKEVDRLTAELEALRAVARGYCPACGRGDCSPTADQWYKQRQRADKAEAERDTARQHAAAIAAQRDRLRQRMNTLADRWDHALPIDKPYARTLRNEISVAPFHGTSTAVRSYRADDGSQKWAARCWGTNTCDGWLSLDHETERWAEVARDRHLAEAHTTPAPAATEATDTTEA